MKKFGIKAGVSTVIASGLAAAVLGLAGSASAPLLYTAGG
ncbi:Uncharacterised protein [Mycobacterium senegalense]|uniref:Uncharacterized protein n=1 Tax=Mycolicibacterium senegalense TaxID=1796 RepID=A0A378W755_9MYCO|nr:Uncharacterised protein [Mycolicibacterium senegalense]